MADAVGPPDLVDVSDIPAAVAKGSRLATSSIHVEGLGASRNGSMQGFRSRLLDLRACIASVGLQADYSSVVTGGIDMGVRAVTREIGYVGGHYFVCCAQKQDKTWAVLVEELPCGYQRDVGGFLHFESAQETVRAVTRAMCHALECNERYRTEEEEYAVR